MSARNWERVALLSPVVWSGYFLLVYAVSALMCAERLHGDVGKGILAVASVATAGLLGVAGYRIWTGGEVTQRFAAGLGLLLVAVSLIASVWTALPLLFISPCNE